MGQYRWKWYRSTLLLTTTAAYTTGTVEYDHVGGSVSRELTLTDGTWPELASFGQVLIGDVAYLIDNRVSDTIVQLRADSNPRSDVTAGTAYKWFRNQYQIPPDIIELGEPKDLERGTGGPDLVQLHPDRTLGIDSTWSFEPTEYPWGYSVERDRRSTGKIMRIAPPPSTARTYAMACVWMPRRVAIEKYETGTVTTVSGSTAVVGVGTSWTSAHIGCVIRVSSNSKPPTSQYGARRNGTDLEMEHNPASVARIVTAVADTTHLTLDADPGVSLSGKAYVISDPIDIDWNVCGIYWDRMCEYFFARNQMGFDADTLRGYAGQVRGAYLEAIDTDRFMDPAPNGFTLHSSVFNRNEYSGLEYIE